MWPTLEPLRWLMSLVAALTVLLTASVAAVAQTQSKPNILVIFGDDIGQTNVSA